MSQNNRYKFFKIITLGLVFLGICSWLIGGGYSISRWLPTALKATPQTASDYVTQGRQYLVNKDLPDANSSFQQALSLDSTNQPANFFYAITRILVLVNQDSAKTLFDRFGMSTGGRNIFNWSATLPMDTEGFLSLPANAPTSGEIQSYALNVLMPQIDGALTTNLPMISTTFNITLQPNETPAQKSFYIDNGEISLYKSILAGVKGAILSGNAYDLNVSIFSIESTHNYNKKHNVYPHNSFNNDFLNKYANFLNLSNPTYISYAKPWFKYAMQAYNQASDIIRSRGALENHVIMLSANDLQKEADFRKNINSVVASLDSTVLVGGNHPVNLNLNQWVISPFSIRSSLPQFQANNSVIPYTFPNPSFNQVLPGYSQKDLARLLDIPKNVKNLQAQVNSGMIALKWQNPFSSDFGYTKLLRKTTGLPANENDGTVVYTGTGSGFMDFNLTNGQTYYYGAFAYHTASPVCYSGGALISAVAGSPNNNVSLIGRLGGDYEDIAIQGNYAYVADEGGLTILNISTAANPTRVNIVNLDDSLFSIRTVGNYIYGLGDMGLWIFSLADPVHPQLVNGVAYSGYIDSMDISGNYAYILEENASRNGMIVDILNITNPAAPVEVTSYPVNFWARGNIVAANNRIYIPDSNNGGFRIFDVTNPAAPSQIGIYNSNNIVNNILAVSGNYLYANANNSYSNGLLVFDISNPASPSLAGTSNSINAYISKIVINNGIAFIGSYWNGFYVFDVSNPANPTMTDNMDGDPSYGFSLSNNNTTIYSVNGYEGRVSVYSINPTNANLQFIGEYASPGEVDWAAFKNKYGYGLNRQSGFIGVADVSNLASPTIINGWPSNGANTFLVNGQNLYLPTTTALLVYDISTPGVFNLTGNVPNSDSMALVSDLVLNSNILYGVNNNGTISVYNIANAHAPYLQSIVTTGATLSNYSSGWSLALDGTRLYSLHSYGQTIWTSPSTSFYQPPQLNIYNITSPASPQYLGVCTTMGNGSVIACKVSQSKAYTLSSQDENYPTGMRAIDVSNVNAPSTLSVYTAFNGGSPLGLAISGNYAYVATSNGLNVLNITTPANISSVGAYASLSGNFNDNVQVVVSGSTAAVIMGYRGVNFYQYSQNTTPPGALFYGTPTSGYAPLNVNFYDISTGVPASDWYWVFGDGQTLWHTQNPTHSYVSSGRYTVTMFASNTYGTTSITKTNYIQVYQAPMPLASFYGSPTSGTVPLRVQFYDTSTGGTNQWNWDFGDGSYDTTQNPAHTYTLAGNYSVGELVSNGYGSSSIRRINYIAAASPVVVGPMDNATRVAAMPSYGGIKLYWNNPVRGDYSGTLIVARSDRYPVNTSDGTIIYWYNGNQCNFAGTNGQKYYFGIFCHDTLMNFSPGVFAAGVPNSYANVRDFSMYVPWLGAAGFTWVNPIETGEHDSEILIRRRDRLPVDPADGYDPISGLWFQYWYNTQSYGEMGLTTGSTYYYGIYGVDTMMNFSAGLAGAFITGYTGLGNVSTVRFIPGYGTIAVSWINPSNANYVSTLVVRKNGSYPSGPTDGSIAYWSNGQSFVDSGLNLGQKYFYGLFTQDTAGNFSPGMFGGEYAGHYANVKRLQAVAGSGSITLNWHNPDRTDYVKTVIIRRTDRMPMNATDGTQVYWDSGTTFSDTSVTNGQLYYYAFFAHNAYFNPSEGMGIAWKTGTASLNAPVIPSTATLKLSSPLVQQDNANTGWNNNLGDFAQPNIAYFWGTDGSSEQKDDALVLQGDVTKLTLKNTLIGKPVKVTVTYTADPSVKITPVLLVNNEDNTIAAVITPSQSQTVTRDGKQITTSEIQGYGDNVQLQFVIQNPNKSVIQINSIQLNPITYIE